MGELTLNQIDRKTRELNQESSYLFDNFTDRVISAGTLGNVLPVTTNTATNVVRTPKSTLYCTNIGTQTLLCPTNAATGLLISLDLTNGDGVCIGLNEPNQSDARFVFTVGSEPVPFFIEARFTLADVSGITNCAIGFRKVEAAPAARATATDYALVGCFGALTKSATQVASGGETLTSSGVATTDGIQITYRVEVDTEGKAKFFSSYNPKTAALDTTGAMYELAISQAYTFTSALAITPVIHVLHAATSPGLITMQWLKCGYVN